MILKDRVDITSDVEKEIEKAHDQLAQKLMRPYFEFPSIRLLSSYPN